jgi:hypothetical protein
MKTLLVLVACSLGGWGLSLAGPVEDLASPEQAVRDQAAEKLRTSYRPEPESKWAALVDGLKKGQTREEVLRQLAPYKVTEEGGWGTLGSYSTGYRLDDEFVLECGFFIGDGEPLAGHVLTRSIRRVPVVPPANYTGKWVIYFANGTKSHELIYKNGNPVGKQASYHANGSVEHVRHFDAEGLQEADESLYDPSGRIRSRTLFRNGKQVGVSSWFDEAGNLAFTRKPHGMEETPDVRLRIGFRPGSEGHRPAIKISLRNLSKEIRKYVDAGYSRGLSFFERNEGEWVAIEEFEPMADRRMLTPMPSNEEIVILAEVTEELFRKLVARTDMVAGIRIANPEGGPLRWVYADEISYRE